MNNIEYNNMFISYHNGRWRLFKKRAVCIEFYIYVFIVMLFKKRAVCIEFDIYVFIVMSDLQSVHIT